MFFSIPNRKNTSTEILWCWHKRSQQQYHGTLKQRTKVMRGMHNKDTAQAQTDGFNIYYNYIREHSTLKTTPAEKANVKLHLKDNKLHSLIKQAWEFQN